MKTNLFVHIVVMMTMLSSCVTNGGDIGDLYGQWVLESYTKDGQDTGIDCTSYYWMFQSNIVCITQQQPDHEFKNHFGTWAKNGDILELDYTHHNADAGSEDFSVFNPPPALGMPWHSVIHLSIIRLTGKHMVLCFIDKDGHRNVYQLNKLK